MKEKIERLIRESLETKTKLLEPGNISAIENIARALIEAYRARKKVVVFGNGGSAADAQHLAAELVCRFELNRRALPALALTTDPSVITSAGNDFGFEDIFSRQVEAHVNPGDVAIGITTSGNSPNVIKALAQAKKQKALTVAFTGNRESGIMEQADLCFRAPSAVTARVQECHGLAIHVICSLVEGALFENK